MPHLNFKEMRKLLKPRKSGIYSMGSQWMMFIFISN